MNRSMDRMKVSVSSLACMTAFLAAGAAMAAEATPVRKEVRRGENLDLSVKPGEVVDLVFVDDPSETRKLLDALKEESAAIEDFRKKAEEEELKKLSPNRERLEAVRKAQEKVQRNADRKKQQLDGFKSAKDSLAKKVEAANQGIAATQKELDELNTSGRLDSEDSTLDQAPKARLAALESELKQHQSSLSAIDVQISKVEQGDARRLRRLASQSEEVKALESTIAENTDKAREVAKSSTEKEILGRAEKAAEGFENVVVDSEFALGDWEQMKLKHELNEVQSRALSMAVEQQIANSKLADYMDARLKSVLGSKDAGICNVVKACNTPDNPGDLMRAIDAAVSPASRPGRKEATKKSGKTPDAAAPAAKTATAPATPGDAAKAQ